MSNIDRPQAAIDRLRKPTRLPLNETWEARRRVADELREVIEQLITLPLDIEELEHFSAKVKEATSSFGDKDPLHGRVDWHKASVERGEDVNVNYEFNPVVGRCNPVSPPLEYWIEEDRAHGKFFCNWSYEGPPGCVHGGIVSALFDDFMGMAQVISGQAGMTRQLDVHYLRPTPLNKELQMEAWVVHHEGRKVEVHAEIRDGDTITATCEGFFIRPRGFAPLGKKDSEKDEK